MFYLLYSDSLSSSDLGMIFSASCLNHGNILKMASQSVSAPQSQASPLDRPRPLAESSGLSHCLWRKPTCWIHSPSQLGPTLHCNSDVLLHHSCGLLFLHISLLWTFSPSFLVLPCSKFGIPAPHSIGHWVPGYSNLLRQSPEMISHSHRCCKNQCCMKKAASLAGNLNNHTSTFPQDGHYII